MFGKKSNDNGEKLYRYSIRKYHFGAASVAIAALMFFANGVAKADMAVSPATANTEKVGVAVTGLTEGVPPTEGHSEKSQEVGSEKEAIAKKSVDKSALNQALSELQAAIAKADEESLLSLSNQLSQLTDENKRLLDGENVSEEAIASQVSRVQSFTEQVRLLKSKAKDKDSNKEDRTDSKVQDKKELKVSDKAVIPTDQTEEIKDVQKDDNKEDTANKDKLESLSKSLITYLYTAKKIERPETKKFLEGVEEVVRSVENGLKNPQLTASEIEELMKKGKQAEKKLALAIAREHSGKRDLDNGKKMLPDSYFRAATYYRAADGKVYDSHGDDRLTEATVGYITKKNDGSGYPPGTILYISHNDNGSGAGNNNNNLGPQPVKYLKNKVHAVVTKNSNGYHWKITYNEAREGRQNPIYYFTLPSRHSVTHMTLSENGVVVKQGGVREVFNGAADKYLTAVGSPNGGVNGGSYYENVANINNGIVGNRGGVYTLDDFVKNDTSVYYNRDGMSNEDKRIMDKLYDKIKSSTQNVFAFRPRDYATGKTPGNKYEVEFDTVGDTEAPLYYIAGMKSYEVIPSGRYMHKSYQQWYGVQEQYNVTVNTNVLKTTFLKGTGIGTLDEKNGLESSAVTIEDTYDNNRKFNPGSGDVTEYKTFKSTGHESTWDVYIKSLHNRYTHIHNDGPQDLTPDSAKGNHTVYIEAKIKGQKISFRLPFRIVTQSDIYQPVAKNVTDTKSYNGNLGDASTYITGYDNVSSTIPGFKTPDYADMTAPNYGKAFYKDRIEDFPTSSARIKEQAVKTVEWVGGSNDLTTGARVIELTVDGKKELFTVPSDIDVAPGRTISAENVKKLNDAIHEAYKKIDTNGHEVDAAKVPKITSATPVWVKKQIKVTYYDNENNARTNNQDDSVDYVDVLFKNIRKETAPTKPTVSTPTDGTVSVTPNGTTDKLVVSYRPTNQNSDTTITVKKSGTTWGTLDTLPNGVKVNSSNGVVSIAESTVKDESTVTAKATYLNSDDATATGVAKNPDNIAPTVTLNGTTLTENASNKTVHVFRGSLLELPLKYYDNAATGRVNISYKNDGGLPQGVWFNDNASGNYDIKQTGNTERNQGAYTVRGNVSNTASLGERPITLKVSDSADGSVDNGNKKEVKFNVRTYDIEPNSTKVTVEKGTTLSVQDAKAAVTKVNGALDLPEGTTYEWVDTNGKTQTVTPDTAGVQSYRVKVTLPSSETGNNAAFRSSKIVNVSVNVRPEAPTVTTEEKYKGTLVSTERSISGTGQPRAKVRITLQDGTTVREVTVENNGKWKYNLASDEKLTQNDKDSTVKASNPISVKQVVNNIESVAKTVNVQMGRAISVETPVQAGREIKVKVAHDTALFYLQVNYGTAKEYQYDVIQENGKWKITDSAKANITELTVADGANISEKILTFRIKDSNKKNNIPFIIPAGNNKVRVRAHYVNEKNNPADPANDGGWATASPATNTHPVISVANQNTTYISDGTLTKDKLKTLVNVTDAEDDNNKTVGNSARENLDVTVTKNGQSVDLTNGKALKQGTYNLTYTTTDAAGVRVTKDHTITVNYIAKAKPIINLIQGENVSDELKRSLLQLQDGNEVINVPNDATVEFTNLDVNTPSDNKNTQVTVVLKNGTRLSPVTLNYNVMKKFETVTKVYDFAGEGRNDSPASYYLNTGGLPGGMSWVVKRGNEAEKNADTNDNMKNMLKSDGVGITNYKFGAKYPRGRFTNNPSETEKLSYTPTFTHEVFDVEANNDPRTQKNRVEVNNGEKLSATQAASAVVKTSNSPALPAGTTFEWVKSATDGTVLTDAEKNVTEFGEITRYVKVTLPKVSETGPNANRVQPYKIIPVTLKVNETVKPTVQMDGRRLTTNAEDNKFVIFRGATFNPTFTVNDNSGTTTYLKASGLPSGREIVKNTAMNNGTTVQISGDDAKTENKALGTYEGSIVVRDARGNNETYKFKYALVDVEVKNTPETVNKGTKLFVPGKEGESKDSHNYVKAVVSPNTDGSDVYYPGGMNFKWSKNNAEITNETVFNTPGAITYNAVVKFPNAKSDKNNVDIDGDGRNENVTIYAPDKVEKTVTFKVKPTAPEVVAKADGGVTISNTNETNVNKIQVTYTPSPTIATLTETDQDTFVEHPATQLTASKNAQNKWSITEGAKDGISIDATSGAITINDATVKDGSQVVAKAITSDSVESAENRATAQDGDKTKPTVGLGNTLVQTGKQITLNLNVSDSGVGVDDSKVEVKNLPAGWQYNRANQTITGSIATASKTDIKVLVRDKKGNKTVKTVSLAAIQPKPIYAIKDGTIDNVGTPSNFVEMPAGVTSPSVSWKDGQPTTATAETTNKTVTVNVADYTATEVDVPVTVYPKVTLRKVDDKEVTEYHEVVGQPLTSAIWKSENAKVSPVKPDFYVAFDGEKPDGTMVEFEGGTPSERSTIAGVTHKTIKVTYPNGAGSVTKEITFKTYGNKPNYPVGKNEFETVVGSPFEKKSARDYVIKASELDNPNGIYVGWGRTGNSANPVNTNQAKVGVRTETVNIWYGNAIEKERGDNANHWFTDQNVEVRLAVKPQAPTLTANQFQGKAGTKPEITVSKLPTANQLGQDATVTVELYQGGNRVASKELSRDEVTQGAGSVHFDATNYTSNLTLGEKVHAVVKVVGGSGNTAYDLSSANSNDVQVTPQKPTFDATAVTSTSRTLSGTLGGFDATNKVVKVHLNDEKNTVLSSANTGEVTITGDKWTATIPDTVKLRQSVSKNGETTKPSGITVENTVTGETVSTTSDEKEVTMGDYSVASTIAGSKHIDITVPHDAKRVELRFHNNQETGEKPNGITLVRGADGTWHTEATRADNTTVTDANGYVGTITATPSATNPAESVITIPLNEESNGKKLHLREEAANGDNTATYGKGLGLRVEYQPEAGQDPAAAGNWKVVNVTNTAPVLSHKGTEGSSETNRKVFPSRTSITKAMLEELVTVGDPEDNAADTNNKPYGTPTVEIVSGLTETPGTATAPGNYIVTLKATDSQGRESNELTLYVEVRKQSDEHDPQAKDPQQEVSHNQEADPEKSVDKTKLPAGTSLAWKDDHKPDTSHPGNQTGIVVVTYPDGTSEDVTVTVKVKEQKDEYQPELKDPQQEVSHNQEADPEKSVDKTKLPAGTSLAWKDDHKPDTSH
ncbi:Rib/alpha-like domain-containing protein, partial [Streptococcus mitis]|uniref:Rib/alpha-like domain-containing protein n=1 Tax=Streptococcus mitis TaxID=28037 RepID=UPI0039C46189